MSLQTLRQQSRIFYPSWSRKQRARWVFLRAQLNARKDDRPRVNISVLNCDDPGHYRFARTA